MTLLVLLWYISLCVLVGCVACELRRSFWGWWILSLVFSPLIGLLCLIALGRSSIISEDES